MRRAASPSPFSLLTLLFILLLLTTPIHALKQPTSYCKCICFQNSTIIPLNSPPSTSASPSSNSNSHSLLSRTENNDEKEPETSRDQKHHVLTCNDCNRAFCLDYNLPICKNAKEEDVFAQCFQRDSLKDRTIVTVFILATASLLGWALVKPFIVKSGVGDVVGRYTPISVNTGRDGDEDGLPGPNGRLVQGFRGGEGGSGGRRVGRGTGGAGGRGSVSRQGGLNS